MWEKLKVAEFWKPPDVSSATSDRMLVAMQEDLSGGSVYSGFELFLL